MQNEVAFRDLAIEAIIFFTTPLFKSNGALLPQCKIMYFTFKILISNFACGMTRRFVIIVKTIKFIIQVHHHAHVKLVRFEKSAVKMLEKCC